MRALRTTGGRAAFIDEFGAAVEQTGLSHQAGRVLGLLLTARGENLTAEEIAAALHLSRGSVSTTIRLLVHLGLVDRLRRPGERRDYFRTRQENFTALVYARLATVSRLRSLVDGAIAVTPPSHHVPQRRLRAVREIFAFFEREYPLLFSRWEAEGRGPKETRQ